MSRATVKLENSTATVDLASGTSLAIPLSFDERQPRFFGAPGARRESLRSGDWVGDTTQGGSCNAEVLTLTPHCNGTHTECIGHVVDQEIAVADAAPDGLIAAILTSIRPEPAGECGDNLPPDLPEGQPVISRRQLVEALGDINADFLHAVVIRSLPNTRAKCRRDYGDGEAVAFVTPSATSWLVERGCEHLLLDLPSLDFMNDSQLMAHRIFFGLPADSHDIRDARRPQCTITEMIFVPDDCEDGPCLLNLQIPAFLTDAVPSRPMIYALTEQEMD
ncbi:MAG: cyclase family protein [Gammaproteobacteria bacterium]|nr:cyclase family protein [Gammaproteobacteria bacterium]